MAETICITQQTWKTSVIFPKPQCNSRRARQIRRYVFLLNDITNGQKIPGKHLESYTIGQIRLRLPETCRNRVLLGDRLSPGDEDWGPERNKERLAAAFLLISTAFKQVNGGRGTWAMACGNDL